VRSVFRVSRSVFRVKVMKGHGKPGSCIFYLKGPAIWSLLSFIFALVPFFCSQVYFIGSRDFHIANLKNSNRETLTKNSVNITLSIHKMIPPDF